MKTKNFKKKLTLNKVTIDHLNNYELKGINGGAVSLDACSEETSCEEICDVNSPTTAGGPGCTLDVDTRALADLIRNP